MLVHDVIATTLREQGVDRVYGLVGDANLYMMDAFRVRGGDVVPVIHEASSVLAAAGDARISGRLGVASVTHGPGLANTVDSLIEVAKARLPVVLIAGDTADADDDNFQDIDQSALVAACGAGFVRARAPRYAAADLRRALQLADSRRMPVVYDIPIDYQWVDVAYDVHGARHSYGPVLEPDAAAVEEAAGILAAARRPLILAGRGAIAARDELVALARRLGAPLATTAQARQLFAGEPFDLGLYGGLATDAALSIMMRADCVLAFGASLNKHTTADGSLVDGRTLVHVDVESESVARHVTPTVGIHADAAAGARALRRLLDEAEVPATTFASESLRDEIRAGREHDVDRRRSHLAQERERERTARRPGATIDLDVALWTVEESFPRPRTLVIDAGRHCITGLGVFSVTDPRHYVHTIHFGSIGVGVPYAIGAALADRSRPTLLLCGDGGFLLGGLVEFHTAVLQKLDLTIVVFNDGAFGAEHVQLVRKGMNPAISVFERPDLAAVAESLGGIGCTVRTIDELEAALAELAHRRGVTVVDIRLDPAEISATA
nr:thiamine pyrophosphate-dependent enzyme [Microbacterium bovistercoris]